MGRDTDSTVNVAWQYGPKRWAYQRAGWTSYKDKYPIYAGKHRWLNVETDINAIGKGNINFSGTFMEPKSGLSKKSVTSWKDFEIAAFIRSVRKSS